MPLSSYSGKARRRERDDFRKNFRCKKSACSKLECTSSIFCFTHCSHALIFSTEGLSSTTPHFDRRSSSSTRSRKKLTRPTGEILYGRGKAGSRLCHDWSSHDGSDALLRRWTISVTGRFSSDYWTSQSAWQCCQCRYCNQFRCSNRNNRGQNFW